MTVQEGDKKGTIMDTAWQVERCLSHCFTTPGFDCAAYLITPLLACSLLGACVTVCVLPW